jgi:hypothetical protein
MTTSPSYTAFPLSARAPSRLPVPAPACGYTRRSHRRWRDRFPSPKLLPCLLGHRRGVGGCERHRRSCLSRLYPKQHRLPVMSTQPLNNMQCFAARRNAVVFYTPAATVEPLNKKHESPIKIPREGRERATTCFHRVLNLDPTFRTLLGCFNGKLARPIATVEIAGILISVKLVGPTFHVRSPCFDNQIIR